MVVNIRKILQYFYLLFLLNCCLGSKKKRPVQLDGVQKAKNAPENKGILGKFDRAYATSQ